MADIITETDTQKVYNSSNASPLLTVNTHFCSAIISLQGGQLLSFTPADDGDWFWLSPLNDYAADSDITGGIPVCLPWFGQHRDASKPNHGFARINLWQLDGVIEHDHELQLLLSFDYSGDKPELFTTPFRVEQKITLSREQLTLELSLQNQAEISVDFSWAWHSYFAVNDITTAGVTGLDQHSYLDKTTGFQRKTQQGTVSFNSEVDAVYEATKNPQQLNQFEISGTDCPTCIVWNPGREVAANRPKLQHHYTDFICVERGCAFGDTITLGAGARHQAQMIIRKHG